MGGGFVRKCNMVGFDVTLWNGWFWWWVPMVGMGGNGWFKTGNFSVDVSVDRSFFLSNKRRCLGW